MFEDGGFGGGFGGGGDGMDNPMREMMLKRQQQSMMQMRQQFAKLDKIRANSWKTLQDTHQNFVGSGKMSTQDFWQQPWVNSFTSSLRNVTKGMGLPDDINSRIASISQAHTQQDASAPDQSNQGVTGNNIHIPMQSISGDRPPETPNEVDGQQQPAAPPPVQTASLTPVDQEAPQQSQSRFGGTGGFNFMGSGSARSMGMDVQPGSMRDMVTRQTAVGKITANRFAADDIAGFLNDLHANGAPLGQFAGVYSPRKIRGGNVWSQHAYGNAVDIESGFGHGSDNSPGLYHWAQQNPQKFQAILDKHHMKNLASFDWGHFEWSPTHLMGGETQVAGNEQRMPAGSAGGNVSPATRLPMGGGNPANMQPNAANVQVLGPAGATIPGPTGIRGMMNRPKRPMMASYAPRLGGPKAIGLPKTIQDTPLPQTDPRRPGTPNLPEDQSNLTQAINPLSQAYDQGSQRNALVPPIRSTDRMVDGQRFSQIGGGRHALFAPSFRPPSEDEEAQANDQANRPGSFPPEQIPLPTQQGDRFSSSRNVKNIQYKPGEEPDPSDPTYSRFVKQGVLPQMQDDDIAAINKFGLTLDQFDFNALRYANGDDSVLKGLGRSKQVMDYKLAIQARAASYWANKKDAEHPDGYSPAEANAASNRFAAQRRAAIKAGNTLGTSAVAIGKAELTIPIVKDLGRKLDKNFIMGMARTPFTDLNALIMWGKEHTSDPNAVRFKEAFTTAIYNYAAGLGAGNQQMTDLNVRHAFEILNPYLARGALEEGLDQLMIELKREKEGAAAGLEEALKATSGTKKAPEAPDFSADEIKKEMERRGIQP